MSNKKFISYFHMLYTGLKGTAGAYMATLLVLLSAFAATGAEKTPTTGADPQALPIKASTKKKSEIIKESPVDTKKTLSSTSDFKVANIVILNNTGLPDSEVYFAIRNTIEHPDIDTNCKPEMTSLFQWYGGTDTVSPTQITNDYYTTDSFYNISISLKDMRGYVASNATSSTSVVNNNHTYWNNKTYSQLLNNYPSSDTTHVAGQFPTISLGLWGACTLDPDLKPYAARMMITTKAPTSGSKEPSHTSPYSPFLVIEGSINPTDKGSGYLANASNFDLSYVDQFSMGANMELWGLNNLVYGPLPSSSYHTGHGLTISADCSTTFYDNINILTTNLSTLSGANNYISFSNTDPPVSPHPYLLQPFIEYLTALTTSSTARVPVLKVASYPGYTFAGTPNYAFPAFGDPSYMTPKEYNFASYFVKVESDGKWWTTIKNQFKADTGLLDTLPTNSPPLITPAYDSSGEWMIMVGRMSNGANSQSLVNKSADPNSTHAGYNYPVTYNMNGGTGPLSVQLDTNSLVSTISMNMSGMMTSSVCTPEIQTSGLGSSNQPVACIDPGSMFTESLTPLNYPCNIVTPDTNGLLGINFSMIQDNFTLSEFDLAAGLTTSAKDGELEVSLVQVTPTNGLKLLNKIVITLPHGTDVGLASKVFDPTNPTAFGNMPLTIDWKKGTCKFNATSLHTSCYLPEDWNTHPVDPKTTPLWQTNLNLVNNSVGNALGGYRIFLKGTNMTVALSSGNPSGFGTAPVIVSTINTLPMPVNPNNYFIYKGTSTFVDEYLSKLNCASNSYLACNIKVTPTDSAATTDLHVLAVPKYNLISYSNGILGNNPSYEFLRYNTQTLAWDTSTSTDTDNPWNGGISKAIVNDVSGRIAGDAMALFSFGLVNSTKLGSDFPTTKWPSISFPPATTAIGALTSGQYFYLMSLQDPTSQITSTALPTGKNLATTNDSSGKLVSYDPYFDVGINQCHANNYFTGFGDRFGGSIVPNPGFSMDVQTGGSSALLGFVPGNPLPQQPVIVITLHPIYRETTTDTIDSDLDDDLDTDSEDIGLMLLAFGVCPPAPETCPEDLNKDGVVDNADLGTLLINFTN